MRIALAGVGRMGGPIGDRLVAAGHRLSRYDAVPRAGFAGSLREAASGADLVLLCLPDAAAVTTCLPDLEAAAPPLVADLTSSEPAVTRAAGERLAARGTDLIDSPLSGGVAGAREGRLTAMVGGRPADLERARPALAAFASNLLWAGPLGSGHALKAINNALSAVALTATSELLVTAAAAGFAEGEALAEFNAGPARSQNSEIKFPRDVLPRTYSSGFGAGLMEKDLATACGLAARLGERVPLTDGTLAAWSSFTAAAGAGVDFTRVHSFIAGRRRPGRPAATRLEDLAQALAAINLMAAQEMVRVMAGEGLDRERGLDIINSSTGRTEATRSGARGSPDQKPLAAADEAARVAGVHAPLLALAARLAGSPDPAAPLINT